VGQFRLSIAGTHYIIDVGVVGGIGIHNEEITLAVDDIGMTAADRRIVRNEIVHIALFLTDTEHRLIQRNPLVVLAAQQIGLGLSSRRHGAGKHRRSTEIVTTQNGSRAKIDRHCILRCGLGYGLCNRRLHGHRLGLGRHRKRGSLGLLGLNRLLGIYRRFGLLRICRSLGLLRICRSMCRLPRNSKATGSVSGLSGNGKTAGCLRCLTGNSETAGCLRRMTGNSETARCRSRLAGNCKSTGRWSRLGTLTRLYCLGIVLCLLVLFRILLCLIDRRIFLVIVLHQIGQGHGLFVRIYRCLRLALLGLLRHPAGLARNSKGRLLGSRLGLRSLLRLLGFLRGLGRHRLLRHLTVTRIRSALRDHRLPVIYRLLRRNRLRSWLGGGLRCRLRCGLGSGLGLYRARVAAIDAVQQLLEIAQQQIGRAVQIIQNLSHIAAVFRLVKLGIEDDILEELVQLQSAAIILHHRQADQHRLTGGDIGIHMIQIQQQHIGIEHIVLGCGNGIDHAIEYAHQTLLVDRTAEELCNRNLGGHVEFDILGGIELLERHRCETGNGVVGQHTQSHGVQLISRLHLIDQISAGTLVFIKDIIHFIPSFLLYVRLRKLFPRHTAVILLECFAFYRFGQCQRALSKKGEGQLHFILNGYDDILVTDFGF